MNGLKKFFLSKNTMLICGAIAILSWLSWIICYVKFAGTNYQMATDGFFYIALTVGLLYAYSKGETNIQKVLLGSLFMLLIKSNIEVLYSYLQMGDMVIVVIDVITLILSLAIFISHIILQSDHAGKTGSIILNQCCGFILIVLMVYFVRQIFFADDLPLIDITFIIGWAFTYMLLVCIETRVQVYKNLRAEALKNGNWDEETRQKSKEIFKL